MFKINLISITGLLCGFLVSASFANSTVFAQSVGVTYYVDCVNGNDANSGMSPTAAWKWMAKAKNAPLTPGDTLLFKRGCTWTNTNGGVYFTAKWNGTAEAPITIGAYGTGADPVFRSDARGVSQNQVNISVTGNYQIIENIRTTLINPYREPSCLQADGQGVRLGWYLGFRIDGQHNTLKNIEADNQALGIFLTDTSVDDHITYANIHDLNALWLLDKTYQAMGGLGVLLHGDSNEVGYSLFERNYAQCNFVDDGIDQNYSAPFEIYNANRSYVHHNQAFEHRKHYEMGKDPSFTSDGNILAYNLFVSSRPKAKGPNIHGSTNPFGPVNNTQIYHNTVVLTGPDSEGMICDCDGGALVRNNIFVAEWKAGYYSENFIESNNVYWDLQQTTDSLADPFVQFVAGTIQTAISPTSIKANPLFVNLVEPGRDYRLQLASPAINRGVLITGLELPFSAILTADLDNNPVPHNGNPDAGAFEN